MTCEDNCLHWEVCKLTPPKCATAKYYTFCNCAEKCECFKDKSKSIELPCKVGDTVYGFVRQNGKLVVSGKEIIHFENKQMMVFIGKQNSAKPYSSPNPKQSRN